MMHYIKLAVIWVFNYFGYKISRVKNPSLMTFEFEMFDEFVDSNGNQFKLLQGYKDRHWGINWEEIVTVSAPTPYDMLIYKHITHLSALYAYI